MPCQVLAIACASPAIGNAAASMAESHRGEWKVSALQSGYNSVITLVIHLTALAKDHEAQISPSHRIVPVRIPSRSCSGLPGRELADVAGAATKWHQPGKWLAS